MGDTQRADGNIRAGAWAFITSISMNGKALLVTQTVSAILAAAAWAFVPNLIERPLWLGLAIVVGIAALAVPIWLSHHKDLLLEQMETEDIKEQAEPIALLRSFLKPCIEMLPQVARSGHEGQEALALVRRAVLTTAQQICGPSGSTVRAVLFEAEDNALVAKDWWGGACNSKRRFTREGDTAGKTAWATAASGAPQLWRDLDAAKPKGYRPGPTSNYKTFITCGVLANNQVRGMLNVDAPQPGDLTTLDEMIVQLCATVLGAAYDLSDRSASVEKSEEEDSHG